MKQFVVSQLGSRMHYAVPIILHGEGMLHSFWTDIDATRFPLSLLDLMPDAWVSGGLQRLKHRRVNSIPRALKHSTNFAGLGYFVEREMYKEEESRLRVHLKYGRRLNHAVVRRGFKRATSAWGFNSAALALFKGAKIAGVECVLEQTIAPRSVEVDILNDAAKRYPLWAEQGAQPARAREFSDTEAQEWALADKIICGSDFVRSGIAQAGGPAEKCVVVPYGVDLGAFSETTQVESTDMVSATKKLRVAVVGTVCLRKGSPVVCEVARACRDFADFTAVGSMLAPKDAAMEFQRAVRYLGPIPRRDIPALLKDCDVLLLPSLCEGSATVVYEALAAGMAVVCSNATGSIVEDGLSGFVRRALDVSGYIDVLRMLHDDRDGLRRTKAAAKSRALFGGFEAYRARLLAALC